MRSRFTAALPPEGAELADEVRRLFRELGRPLGADPLAGECVPSLDVYENDEALEIVVDLPGVQADTLRVAVKGDVVLIVGVKMAGRPTADSSFHLVERDFGRFARSIHINRPCDTSRARARLVNGELHVSLPKIADRRGRARAVPIDAA